MRTRVRIASLLASLLYATASYAGARPVLIAVGNISGASDDMAAETAGPLENGVPGNRLGGVGSGLAHAGGNTFLAVADRGPNANPYDSCVDDTTSYITRFHTFRLALEPSPSGAALPFTLTPALLDTTLLSSPSPVVYGLGGSYGVGCGVLPTGVPALNAINHTHYLTGRSDGFDRTQVSASAVDGRFDPESIRVANNGESVFISDEYGPYVYQFDRRTGNANRRVRVAEPLRHPQPWRDGSGRDQWQYGPAGSRTREWRDWPSRPTDGRSSASSRVPCFRMAVATVPQRGS